MPLYKGDEDKEVANVGRRFLIPNPDTMKPPVLSEGGKADYYIITCGQEVGIFGSK